MMKVAEPSSEALRKSLEDIYKKIPDILEKEKQNKIALKIIRNLQTSFSKILKQKVMFIDKAARKQATDEGKTWMRKKYNESKGVLLRFLLWKNKNVQEIALCDLMILLKTEATYPFYAAKKEAIIPVAFFQDIINTLLRQDRDMKIAINRFQEFTEFDDIQFHLLKILNSILKQNKPSTQNFVTNFYGLLEQIKIKDSDDNGNNFFISPNGEKLQEIDQDLKIKLFNSTWMTFLKLTLTTTIYKKILIILHDQVLPHLQSPLLLTDFLIDSFNTGGVVSVLALTSLFHLMQNYNLEYPEFYKKFYSLLTPEIFHTKYRARFFYLSDLFLSSTHLPEYLIAAFIKKFSRLALTATPNINIILIPFIRNLIIRHRSLNKLIHNPLAETEIDCDPFLMEEADPAKCRAVESSLWELKTLQSHYNPEISNAAKMIEKNLPKIEADLSERYETTITDMIEKETEREWEDVALVFEKPKGLSTGKFFQYWSLK